MRLLIVWLINTVALIAVAYLLPGVSVATFASALVAALVLGLVNAVIRPVKGIARCGAVMTAHPQEAADDQRDQQHRRADP